MNEADVDDIKQIFNLWNSSSSKDKNKDMNSNDSINLVKEDQFVDFMNELLPGKVSNKALKHFFQLYKNNPEAKKADPRPD